MKQTQNVEELQQISKIIRRHIIVMLGEAKSGHPGGSLSAVETLVTLFWDVMRHDPANPEWPDRDRFILSKGHAAPVLYAVMAECGYCPLDSLNTLRKLGSPYQGHPDKRFLPVLEASTGSLGEGLSLGMGMGLAARLDKRPARTYVMLGDGEIQEGQIWEAAMFGAFHKIDNVVRHRGLQQHPAGRLRQGHHGAGAAGGQVAAPSAGTPSSLTATTSRRSRRLRRGGRGQGPAHRADRAHHQGQRRLVHGEQPQVPRRGARPRKKWSWR